MRQIIKRDEPDILHEFKRAYRGARYEDLPEDTRRSIRNGLVAEQYGLCAYCTVSIYESACHIEHIKPRSRFPKQSLMYDNLVASCNSKESCGGCKKNQYEERFIAPTEKDCKKAYSYTADGRIRPNSERAKYTIDVLNLNSRRLKNARRAAIMEWDFCGEDSENNRQNILDRLTQPDDNGRLPSFCAAAAYVIGNN